MRVVRMTGPDETTKTVIECTANLIEKATTAVSVVKGNISLKEADAMFKAIDDRKTMDTSPAPSAPGMKSNS